MTAKYKSLKIILIVLLIVGIQALHYLTIHEKEFHHAVFRILFYLPLVLGSFWFGLRGAVCISAAIIIPYLPFGFYKWQNLSQDYTIFLEGGLFVFIALVLGYLSEREKKAQRARIEAERLAAIGKAVSEVAHDMKTPLMTIGGFVNQVAENLQSDERDKKKLDLAVSETARLESMVKEMLDFGRPLELQKSKENLNSLTEECVELLTPLAKDNQVELKTEFGSELPQQPLDKNRIKQVIINLITNAIQASAKGKTILLRTGKVKNGVVLDVSDSGSGINEEDREKIFEPFFSTKKQGTGLGLAIVKKIVESHGGSIFLYPNQDEGVTFSIRLPR